MSNIIRGTTPTLKYTFKTIKVSDITTAYLSINATEPFEKTLEEALVGEDFIAWTLTQAETLSLGDSVEVQLNWKLTDGTRGASKENVIMIADNLKAVVI